jgi:hypothetical protein
MELQQIVKHMELHPQDYNFFNESIETFQRQHSSQLQTWIISAKLIINSCKKKKKRIRRCNPASPWHSKIKHLSTSVEQQRVFEIDPGDEA